MTAPQEHPKDFSSQGNQGAAPFSGPVSRRPIPAVYRETLVGGRRVTLEMALALRFLMHRRGGSHVNRTNWRFDGWKDLRLAARWWLADTRWRLRLRAFREDCDSRTQLESADERIATSFALCRAFLRMARLLRETPR